MLLDRKKTLVKDGKTSSSFHLKGDHVNCESTCTTLSCCRPCHWRAIEKVLKCEEEKLIQYLQTYIHTQLKVLEIVCIVRLDSLAL